MVIYVFPIGVLLFQSLEKERKRNLRSFFIVQKRFLLMDKYYWRFLFYGVRVLNAEAECFCVFFE